MLLLPERSRRNGTSQNIEEDIPRSVFWFLQALEDLHGRRLLHKPLRFQIRRLHTSWSAARNDGRKCACLGPQKLQACSNSGRDGKDRQPVVLGQRNREHRDLRKRQRDLHRRFLLLPETKVRDIYAWKLAGKGWTGKFLLLWNRKDDHSKMC